MEKHRKKQILFILALLFAVTAMTIGFATFSSVLTISSSATVKPTDSEFKLKMYGLTDENINDYYFAYELPFSDENSARVYAPDSVNDENLIATSNYAALNNIDMTISNIFTEINNPGDYAMYAVKVANEGSYSAYIDTAQLGDFIGATGCIPDEGTTSELVESACTGIGMGTFIVSTEVIEAEKKLANEEITQEEYETITANDCFSQGGVCEIKPNEYIVLQVMMTMSNEDINGNEVSLADGPFTAYFPDIKLEFTSTPPESQS